MISHAFATLSPSGGPAQIPANFLKILLAFSFHFCYYISCAYENGAKVRNSKEVQRMAKCEFCDKGVTFGIKVSHSHRRSNRSWKPNVKRVKAIVDGSPRHVYVCTRCMRSGKVTRAV
jgi:large subunit ribosomal protein L28